MRYLLDTNILVFWMSDHDSLDGDVYELLCDYSNILCVSAESLREMIVAFRNKNLLRKIWKSEYELIRAVTEEFNVNVLPLKKEHFSTYSNLVLNKVEDHNDPSDHIIISHAITENLPLISSDHKFLFYKKQGLDLIYNKR